MPNKDDIAWFKQEFAQEINAAVAGTVFDVDMITAIACQETGFIWSLLRKTLPRERVLELCVGDTLDRKKTFPKNKDDLVSAPHGEEMFAIARAALVDMADHVPGYKKMVGIPTKFCHGFGLFQYDIQFFRNTDPDYFLERRYVRFDQTLGKCIGELKSKLIDTLKWGGKKQLTDMEKAAVAIAYNSGGYDPALGLKQGHQNDAGEFYGDLFFGFMQLSRTVPRPAAAAPGPKPVPKPAPAPKPAAGGAAMVVNTVSGTLTLRRTAEKTATNSFEALPKGQPVTAFEVQNGFRRIKTVLNGKSIEGWLSAEFLKKA